jgi:hypothetical protein
LNLIIAHRASVGEYGNKGEEKINYYLSDNIAE